MAIRLSAFGTVLYDRLSRASSIHQTEIQIQMEHDPDHDYYHSPPFLEDVGATSLPTTCILQAGLYMQFKCERSNANGAQMNGFTICCKGNLFF